MNKTQTSLIIIIVGRICIAFAAIVSVRASTYFLTPSQLGSITQLTSLYTFFNLLFIVPVLHYFNRGFIEWYHSRKILNFSKLFLGYILIITILSIIFSGIIQSKWKLISGYSVVWVFTLTGLSILFNAINSFATTGLNLLKKRSYFVIFTIITSWTSLGFSILLFINFNNNVAWNLGQIIGVILGCFSIIILWKYFLLQNLNTNNDVTSTLKFSVKEVFKFSWPIIIISTLWWIQSQSYKFILGYNQGIENVGYFIIGYSLAATPIGMYETIMSQYLEPIFFSELKNQGSDGQAKAWDNYAKLYLPGLIVIGIFISFSSPYLANILISEKYRTNAIKIAFWASFIETIRAAGAMMYHLGMAKVDNRMTILPAAIGAIISPITIYYIGKIDPIFGTLISLFLAGFISFLVTLYTSRFVLPITWPIRKVLVAFLYSIPIIIFFTLINYLFKKVNFIFSFSILFTGFLYVAMVQFKLLRR